jgi:DNA-binding transcriptional LysR family regulator
MSLNLLAVVETLHFGGAAQIGVAQPNLSQQIKKIEKILGHALFERTTRGVALTAVGASSHSASDEAKKEV